MIGLLAVAVIWMAKRIEEKDETIILLQKTYADMVLNILRDKSF